MIVVAYQRTQAGALLRAAQRGRTLIAELPAPKPPPKPVVAPVAVLLRLPVLPKPFLAWAKPEKPAYLAIEPVTFSSVRRIISKVVAWHDGVTIEDVLGKSRQYHIIPARFDAIAAAYLNCRIDGRRYSLPELGRAFGGRDHTTVLYALRQRGIIVDPLDRRSPQPGDGTNT